MKTTVKLATAATLLIASSSFAFAAHNNPWAGEDDVLLSRFHDENQLKSVGKPGEDEMRGDMKQQELGRGNASRGGQKAGNGKREGGKAGKGSSGKGGKRGKGGKGKGGKR